MNILKGVVFYPLLWLRGLLIRIGRLIAGLLLFSALLSALMGELPTQISITFAVMSFALFMLCHFYDWILIKLNPTDNILILD
ncbi:conserved hypothetical protein [Vibrio crassostreae]|uniref:hypothetical protein n=1 Tax=Vibrio crassostreae TaxID=246167 RepID=UPI00104345CB|nr:hypothetical protein [Vibrio crassostreae]TCT60455.1 hypothetical protein EDB44_11276 [Vibrio crassostreae]TCT82187.1 hypothetical protein EDB43_11276 [Vibrio crassostreae]CAK3333889.1 conserved hypothetical protein [Vibrio crassostreae]